MVFPVVMYGCESWTIKKAEHRRTDAFELWCWRRLLRVPWTARKFNHSSLRRSVLVCIGRSHVEAEIPILWPLDAKNASHLKRPWYWERLRTGGEGDNRGWDGWMASPTRWTWVWANSGRLNDREALCGAVHGVAKSWTQLSEWTELSILIG